VPPDNPFPRLDRWRARLGEGRAQPRRFGFDASAATCISDVGDARRGSTSCRGQRRRQPRLESEGTSASNRAALPERGARRLHVWCANDEARLWSRRLSTAAALPPVQDVLLRRSVQRLRAQLRGVRRRRQSGADHTARARARRG
jgi:hypothetical protein